MAIRKFPLVLISARRITPRVRELTFTRDDGEPIDFTPGQFVTLHLPHEGQVLRRSYSIATMTEDGSGAIAIAVTQVSGGRASNRLFAMAPGEKIDAAGPFGRFILRDDPPCRYLLFGTGTGVSPYRAMLPELERRIELEDFTVELFLGVRGPDELLYGEDFAHFAHKHHRFHFHSCFSRRMPASPGPFQHQGYVQHLMDTISPDPQRDIAYLCGNPDMIDRAAGQLSQLGFPLQNIRREKYISAN